MNALEIHCPKCKGELETKYGVTPAVHWSFAEWEKYTKRAKTKKREYFHCTKCGKDFVNSYAMVEIDREKMKVKKAYV